MIRFMYWFCMFLAAWCLAAAYMDFANGKVGAAVFDLFLFTINFLCLSIHDKRMQAQKETK
jgi:hypothetical protein